MNNIEYLSYVGQHKYTYTHPHYQSIYNNPPNGYKFSSNAHERDNKEYDHYVETLRKEFIDLTNEEEANKFIDLRNSGGRLVPDDAKFCFAPTHGCFFTNKNWSGNYEDWTCLTVPHNIVTKDGATHGLDLKNQPWVKLIKHVVMKDNCKYLFTHMKQTIQSLEAIFGEDVAGKVVYLPLATPPVEKKVLESKFDHSSKKKDLCFLFTNSYGAGIPNFPLRGGYENFYAFKKFIDDGRKDVRLYMLGPMPKSIEEEARPYSNIHVAPRFLDDKEFDNVMFNTDVMLIPAMRVHTISIVNSMKRGIPCLGTDGWGYDQFLKDGYNGWVCEGQAHATYVDDEGIYRDNLYGRTGPINKETLEKMYHKFYSGQHANKQLVEKIRDRIWRGSINLELVDNIYNKLCHIYENRDELLTIRQNCVNFVQKEFDINKRNQILKSHLDEFYED